MNRYKHHHNILEFLVNEYNANFRLGFKVEYTHLEIAKKFKISNLKALEILTELREDNSINFTKPDRYITDSNGFKNIKLNKYKRLSLKYNRDFIVKNVKDVIIILVGLSAIIFPFIIPKIEYKSYEKDLKLIQSQVDSIKLEQTKMKANQNLILKDSLFLK